MEGTPPLTPEIQQNAAIRLLGLSQDEIKSQVADIIFGQMEHAAGNGADRKIRVPIDEIVEEVEVEG